MSIFSSWLPLHRHHSSNSPQEQQDQRLVDFLKTHTPPVPPSHANLEDALMAQIATIPQTEGISQTSSKNSIYRHKKLFWVAASLVVLCFGSVATFSVRSNAPQLTVAEEEVIEKNLLVSWLDDHSDDHNSEINGLNVVAEDPSLTNHDELDMEAELALINQSAEISRSSEPE